MVPFNNTLSTSSFDCYFLLSLSLTTHFPVCYLLSIFSYCCIWFRTWLDLAIEVMLVWGSQPPSGFTIIEEYIQWFSILCLKRFSFFSPLNNVSHPAMYADPDFAESRIGWVTMNVPIQGWFRKERENLIQLQFLFLSSTKPEMIVLIFRMES